MILVMIVMTVSLDQTHQDWRLVMLCEQPQQQNTYKASVMSFIPHTTLCTKISRELHVCVCAKLREFRLSGSGLILSTGWMAGAVSFKKGDLMPLL
jgi:hypothetical protein